MKKFNSLSFLVLLGGFAIVSGAQQESPSPELKAVAVRDAACAQPLEIKQGEPTLTALPIRSGGHEVGKIIAIQGSCHCQGTNCDTLVYLRSGEGYRLALHEKYASLHPMKIVKQGMPSLTGQFELSSLKMETTVYDWNGKDYRPSLCATVTKGKKVPSIAQHPCKLHSQ
jgi:hypothetical protein